MTSQLRIGNYLNGKKGPVAVSEIRENNRVKIHDNASSFTVGTCLPFIPLTEEWLLNFGFERMPWGLVKGGLLFRDNIKNPCQELTLEVGNGFSVTVQYLHQLQNLYFALIGEELTLNP